MTIVCPRLSESLGCTMRAVMSTVPPGGKVTMNRIGLAGYSCASACDPMPIAQPAIRPIAVLVANIPGPPSVFFRHSISFSEFLETTRVRGGPHEYAVASGRPRHG